jgi:hypothetical protein
VVVGEKLRSLKNKADVSELDVTSMTSINTFRLKVGDEPVDILLNIAGKFVRQDGLQSIDSLVRCDGAERARQFDNDKPLRPGEDIRRQYLRTAAADSGTASEHIESVFSENREHGKLRNDGIALEFSDAHAVFPSWLNS